MQRIMHDASFPVKCQMHHRVGYTRQMETMAQRLRAARVSRGYGSAVEGADALGVARPTYIQHENGTRKFTREAAVRYARFFKTTPEWLLYGRGKIENQAALPSTAEMEAMIRDAISEVLTLGTKLSDLPRIVAPSLLEQLERYQADRANLNAADEAQFPGKGDQLPPPTNPS